MLTKLLIKMACMGAMATASMTYIATLHGKDPLAYLSAMSFKAPNLAMPSLPDMPDIPKMGASVQGKTTVYRWTDADGGLQFSTSPPPAGTDYKTVHLDPNTNLVQAQKLPEKQAESESGNQTSARQSAEGDTQQEGSEELPSYDDIGDIKQQLNDLKAMNENRINDLNAIIGKQKN